MGVIGAANGRLFLHADQIKMFPLRALLFGRVAVE